MPIDIAIEDGATTVLAAVKQRTEDNSNFYHFVDQSLSVWIKAELTGSKFEIKSRTDEVAEDNESLQSKLDELAMRIIEIEQSGSEFNDFEEMQTDDDIKPFNPEDIKVHAKQFSLRLISDMIEEGDIDMTPDFQRNLVWNNFQKSRLIESILLRIPLPMFYFSEDKEGKMTIVDGLQRLTTIKEFMDNKFKLSKLEYLEKSCEGRYYKDQGNKDGLEAKYLRWFKQTQFSVNVIDASSPPKVKYDIFRRINTGGKPLNNQEIRNCLASKQLRKTLKEMTELEEFKTATDWSIRPTRMEDQEVALRFILFTRLLDKSKGVKEYSGYMDTSLDDLTEDLQDEHPDVLYSYVKLFSNAMKNAEYLIGHRHAFRKIVVEDLDEDAYKQLINKALFASTSVLLSKFDHKLIIRSCEKNTLAMPIAENIDTDIEFHNYLTYGTNGRNNLLYVFDKMTEIIDTNLKVN
jgi:uncharacterized protein with ParB-like and HNH nuclease domain